MRLRLPIAPASTLAVAALSLALATGIAHAAVVSPMDAAIGMRSAAIEIGSAALAALAAPDPAHSSTAPAAAARDTALFAGGCFWCMETAFEGRPGVLAAISGYSGGHTSHPTYEEVNTHTTGHLETVEVIYDPSRITYDRLLDIFWHSIDPTQANGQFCDRGNSYYSAIFWRDDAQRRAAERTRQQIVDSGVLTAPVVTQIRRAGPFYRAEEYHQDFYKKDPDRYHAYRESCGRDRRLREIWGDRAAKPSAH